MEAVAKSEIFFVVTTVVVVLCGIISIIAGVFIVKIFRDLSEITSTIKKQTELLSEDIERVRNSVKAGSSQFGILADMFKSIFNRRSRAQSAYRQAGGGEASRKKKGQDN